MRALARSASAGCWGPSRSAMSVRRNADRATSPVKHFFFLSRSRYGPSGEHTCTWCFEMPVRVRRRNSDERIHGPCRKYYSWCCVKMLFLEFVFTTGTWSRSRCGPTFLSFLFYGQVLMLWRPRTSGETNSKKSILTQHQE